mgnify:CR=1 FL=1
MPAATSVVDVSSHRRAHVKRVGAQSEQLTVRYALPMCEPGAESARTDHVTSARNGARAGHTARTQPAEVAPLPAG